MDNDLVRGRVEVKYRTSRASAESLIASLRAEALPSGLRARSAWVTTVYLDLPDRRLLRAARRDPRTAVKLRIREYFDADGSTRSPHVWLELKEQDGDWSRKYRFPLPKSRVGEFLDGTLGAGEILDAQPSESEDVADSVRRIRELASSAVSPVGAVRYQRFSVEGGAPAPSGVEGPHVRLTVDRHISYHVGPLVAGLAAGPSEFPEKGAVVEVKHVSGSMPAWCVSLLSRHAPAEYSKFGVISRLVLSKASVG